MDIKWLLEDVLDFLMGLSRHIRQPQALHIFNFDEGITNNFNIKPPPFIYEIQELHKTVEILKKLRCVVIRVDSYVVITLRNESYASVCRSFMNVNQSLQFAFIRHEISDLIRYNT